MHFAHRYVSTLLIQSLVTQWFCSKLNIKCLNVYFYSHFLLIFVLSSRFKSWGFSRDLKGPFGILSKGFIAKFNHFSFSCSFQLCSVTLAHLLKSLSPILVSPILRKWIRKRFGNVLQMILGTFVLTLLANLTSYATSAFVNISKWELQISVKLFSFGF